MVLGIIILIVIFYIVFAIYTIKVFIVDLLNTKLTVEEEKEYPLLVKLKNCKHIKLLSITVGLLWPILWVCTILYFIVYFCYNMIFIDELLPVLDLFRTKKSNEKTEEEKSN